MLTYRPALASADETGDRDAWECSILDCIVGSQDDEIFVMRVFRGVEVSRGARHGGGVPYGVVGMPRTMAFRWEKRLEM